ncbi:Na(+)/H(+) antiporter [Cytospora mali]|uniref:Na(+)/H(+) antiporter n=1 Tax=Cytospora mali TaxID=578113 RepID=A0A194VF95_CYTMA|nr:Na(+)/H(+) antiporter [Valsa mali var. pyri (nom. inval.)]
MAWDHLSITKPHLVYIILGGFTSLFMLCSSVIKERMYIGEATVATVCGVIFGPHAANLIDPMSWGDTDIITIEFSRLVLVVQCFAVGVELPKFYMEKHWKSVVFLLVPVMTFGWLVTSLFVWWMIPPLNWLESLVVAACVTATDPVLASSVVGKGKFAKRVPKHLRDLLSAESGCNDGMAFPFVYLSIYLIQDKLSAKEVSFHWIVYTILYECIFGAIYGFVIGYIARHGIKYAEKRDLIDRESFLVFYFVLALWCAGSGSILGVDDLLVGFACGVGFSNDGWFTQKTEESHVSNVIDLLINLAYFVYFGTIIPWEQYNNSDLGLTAWRLVVIALFVIFFRRIPIMMALKPLIPDIKTWREALFAGHFGPIGVGAIFVAMLARGELEHEDPVPLSVAPTDHNTPHYTLLTLVWPIVTFLVIASIIIHGSSVAVFTLGKRINTLTLTMSYTTAPEDGPSWMNRLPRISSQSKSQARTMSDTDGEELKMPDYPPGTLPPIGYPGNFLRRVKEEDQPSRQGSRASSLVGRRRSRKKWDDGIGPGGPVTQSAIFPQRRSQSEQTSATLRDSHSPPDPEKDTPSDSRRASGTEDFEKEEAMRRAQEDAQEELEREEREIEREDEEEAAEQEASGEGGESPSHRRRPVPEVEVYDEGNHIIVENEQGDVIAVEAPGEQHHKEHHMQELKDTLRKEAGQSQWSYEALKKRLGNWREEEVQKRKDKQKSGRRHEPARAYQFGNTIIVEDEDGEVVKKYDLPPQKAEAAGGALKSQGLKYMGMGGRGKAAQKPEETGEASTSAGEPRQSVPRRNTKTGVSNWVGGRRAGEGASQKETKKSVAQQAEKEDDRHIRFTIGGVGQRMTKDDFLREMKKLDKSTRKEVVEQSTASPRVKTLAKEDPPAPATAQQSAKGKVISSPQPAQASQRVKVAEPSSFADTSRNSSSKAPARRQSPPSSGDISPTEPRYSDDAPSRDVPETAVEKRRRLAVLKGLEGAEDDSEDTGETPAERRRREAALGVSGSVPPARRGIRFADTPERGRK